MLDEIDKLLDEFARESDLNAEGYRKSGPDG